MLCQVPPGFTRALAAAAHDRLYYQVETLVSAARSSARPSPERFIVGCADPRQPLLRRYASLLDAFGCPILPMRYESAELAKIAINAASSPRSASPTRWPNSASNRRRLVRDRAGAEARPRIGQYSYLAPGLGIAGGNLERDLRDGRLTSATAHGTDADVVRAWLANSATAGTGPADAQAQALLAKPDAAVAVLGLAYKENTHSTKNSPSLALLEHLPGDGCVVHDPVVPAIAAPCAQRRRDPLGRGRGADALVILTPWPQYRDINPARLAQAMRGRIVLDPYRVLDGRGVRRGARLLHARHAALGAGRRELTMMRHRNRIAAAQPAASWSSAPAGSSAARLPRKLRRIGAAPWRLARRNSICSRRRARRRLPRFCSRATRRRRLGARAVQEPGR